MTGSDIRRVFSEIIFSQGESIRYVGIYERGEGVKYEYRGSSSDNSLPIFPEIEEIVDIFLPSKIFYQSRLFDDREPFELLLRNDRVKLIAKFSSRENLRDYINAIKEHKDRVDEKLKEFSMFLPDNVEYLLGKRYSENNELESFDVEILFKIGFHKNLLKANERVWGRIYFSEYSYVRGLKYRYFLNDQRYRIEECILSASEKRKGNVALIKPNALSDYRSFFFVDTEELENIFKEIAKNEEKNIKYLVKGLLLQ